ncbi:MAG: glycosyltransferase family 2 protein [Bacteroidales bacterium]|nr:glycosyltransferase family 2 protein [Bacteroidales bacterium]
MKNEPLVSIVTPLYNSANFLPETLDSVLNQTYKNWEMFIIDDCSKDNGLEIALEYAKKDSRINVVPLKKNSGAACSRNVGIAKAKGDFIAFVDSDDVWMPQKLEKQLNFMLKNNYYLTYTSYQRIDEEGNKGKIIRPPKKVWYKKMLFQNYIGLSTAMINVKEFGKKFFIPHIRREDYAYWLKILQNDLEYAYLYDDIVINYRVRKGSLSSNKIKLVRYQLFLYNQVIGLNYIKSLFYTLNNIALKVLKIK